MNRNKLMVVILKDDYGIPEHGESYEYKHFYQTLKGHFTETKLFDFGPYLHDTAKLQVDIKAAADAFQPDLIFFTLYQDQFDYDTLDYLSNKYVTVNWFCDDEWRFESFASRYCHHFRYVATMDHFAIDKYKKIGYDRAILSQWATSEILPSRPKQIDYQYDVTFIGGVNPYRRWFVEWLSKQGIQVQGFGTGWPNGRVNYDQMNDVFLRSKINLNISNSRNTDIRFVLSSYQNWQNYRHTAKNKEQVKGRHFEIAGAGGFQLTNYVEFLDRYLVVGDEISVYSSIDNLVDLIKYYLAHDQERELIAQQGHARVLRDHSYDRRFLDLFSRLK